MKTYNYPDKKNWNEIIERSVLDNKTLYPKVQAILDDVKLNGDEAIKKYALQFDKIVLDSFLVTKEEIEEASMFLSEDLKIAIQQAQSNILRFHESQVQNPEVIETMPGIKCWRKSVGIEKVGLYIPGGSAPLFSTILMLGIPAKIAGCKEIILCTPPSKDGSVHPAILYTAQLVGITQIFKIGGVQAIAAMAYGTAAIPKVYKIFGPGNQFVTCAKQLIQQDGVAIDMPAGPSEVCVLADESANAAFIASDLLSQAEHGVDSQSILVTVSEQIAEETLIEVEKQLAALPRKTIAEQALNNSKIIVLKTMEEAVALVNEYASEHLIISCNQAEEIGNKVINSGSIFFGNYSPESVGDYASGTNHTLPTNGYARAYSGVSVDSFVKKITYQYLSKEGLMHIAKTIELMADAEGLDAHANAVRIRTLSPKGEGR